MKSWRRSCGRAALRAALVLGGLGLSAAETAAQRGMSAYAAYNHVGDANVVSAGTTIELGRGRLVPTVGVNAFWASFPGLTEDLTSFGVTPAVGLMYRPSEEMFLHGSVGYHFSDDEFDPRFAEGAGGNDGVVTNGMIGYYGMWPLSVEAIASYNWGSDYLWSRGRGAVRVASLGNIGVSLGAELTLQGVTDVDDGLIKSYGPLLRFSWPSNISLGIGAGWRDLPGENDNYFKVELGWYR